ncbi:MAG: 16S rRNA (adenine(1518)-N(6)/adenine(1519)-N(6))-dimethyltransferase RsmA [candidate division KSB1 bacterium]|nr:16S rRNA (adenine(1518)-N(6)/adenine(1519)-N(6))-dimethyltransferase RsmA [candidate division KSB1 bacterium]MDQ7065530.1 16S rRNA (adenine(1518)-N(6)/adenine(1519)-N(6))-dimethyltransferase RsmA [candidate division KSB1 bacterium]
MSKDVRRFQARKSLGQNFLTDENIARKIVRLFVPKPGDRIVEIGPGFGVLTRYLVESGCEYFGIEIDERLIPELESRFGQTPNVHIIHADFRTFLLESLASAAGERLRLIGNIPYHITSSILFTAFRQHERIQDMMLMVQREVAERIVAEPGNKDYSLLSVLSQTFSKPKIRFHVSKHVFQPKPDVESSIVSFAFESERIDRIADKSFYIETVKKLFGQRRKTLRNSLRQIVPKTADMDRLPIDLQRRIETLSVDEMIDLVNHVYTILH